MSPTDRIQTTASTALPPLPGYQLPRRQQRVRGR